MLSLIREAPGAVGLDEAPELLGLPGLGATASPILHGPPPGKPWPVGNKKE